LFEFVSGIYFPAAVAVTKATTLLENSALIGRDAFV
jgi:hypothetical protein